MNLQDFAKLLRSRWMTICATVVVAILGGVAVTLLTTPLYEATTRLFVSATAGTTANEAYQGNRYSQERVLSYTELLKGETLAQRTIDKLGLSISSAELQQNIKASAKPDTVLIDVSVTDVSPTQARDIANALSDEFVVMVRELETPEQSGVPDSRVVVEQRASLPERPVTPKPVRNISISLAFGLLLGVGIAVLRDLLDNTIKDRQPFEEITGVSVVGSIPADKERRKNPAVSFATDNTAIAEAFRKLRTNLQFLSVDNPPRIIVVTSSLPNEGKTTTAINIALSLAEADHNVLLVDGDMRQPKMGSYLNLVDQVGLSTVLSGAAPLAEVLQKSSFPGLTVLTSGAIPPNPSELLGSKAAQKLLRELRDNFDYVIIDSSPLLAVTDAAVISTISDGVLVIARFGQTKRDQLAHAMRNLDDVGATPLGAIFTMTPERGHSTYNYGYYGYGGASKSTSSRQVSPTQDTQSHVTRNTGNAQVAPGGPVE
ncbi:polysaccharide biosynthesis tyrosine autokinase [Mycobacterium sp. Root135]|uniref:polysaccharide biosynthesis tyrosine autokinase n=1 Tax=Mycobacterium sp. Root135 TaxID=1736457 RepID=UPI0009E9702D|nr:polysaccharide biosynthesis tyrosine autokinase [Mycobacterium sp. Root135]